MPDWHAITDKLGREHGIVTGSTISPQAVGGGDINAAWRLETNTGYVFLKTSHAELADMFSAEAEGLQELADAKAIRVPAVLGYGSTNTDAYLVLEWLELTRTGRIQEEALGHQLARQHRVTSESHGWHRDNTIGLTHQPNSGSRLRGT